jgi:peptidoglycan hydrolase-like protein with peptidoglycan-binding domain
VSQIAHQTQTSTNRPLYQSGDRGADVSVIQQYLAAAGYSPGKIDGIYGPSTTVAVQQFQQANGINPDGVIWLDTFNALANAVQTPPSGGGGSQPQPTVADGDPSPNPDAASGSSFPQWAIYLGVAAAGAIALYFLSTRFTHKPAMAGYAEDEGCSCPPRHQMKKRRLRS